MKTKKVVCYTVGSIIVFAFACLLVPKLSKMITNKIYKASLKIKK